MNAKQKRQMNEAAVFIRLILDGLISPNSNIDISVHDATFDGGKESETSEGIKFKSKLIDINDNVKITLFSGGS